LAVKFKIFIELNLSVSAEFCLFHLVTEQNLSPPTQNAQLPSACAYLGSLVGTKTGNEFRFYLKMMVAHLIINDLI